MIRAGVIAILIAGSAAAQDVPALNFEANDPEMLAAIDAARLSLPYFFGAAATDGVTGQAIKVAVPLPDGGIELLWMDACRPSETTDLTCRIANQPAEAQLLKDDAYHLKLDAIADWMFFDEAGLIHGAYTARAMVPRLSEREAAAFTARLAPLPEPQELPEQAVE
ncbi:MAG: DUF2314 domain-containing protein [Pseudomonadota bacterium]